MLPKALTTLTVLTALTVSFVQPTFAEEKTQPVYIYVLDTGVDGTHPGFEGRVTTGYDAFTQTETGNTDCNGHGTAVASIAASSTVGLAKNATIIPVKVLDCDLIGSEEAIGEGISWILNNHPQGIPGIVNFSIGGMADSATAPSTTNERNLEFLLDEGFFVTVVAGNDSDAWAFEGVNPEVTKTIVDACSTEPGRDTKLFTVAAANTTDPNNVYRAKYSNAGKCVDAFAPGQLVNTLTPTNHEEILPASGTSYAAPYAAGLAALILEKEPQLSPEKVAQKLIATASWDTIKETPDTELHANTQYTKTGAGKTISTIVSTSPNILLGYPFQEPKTVPTLDEEKQEPEETPITFLDAITNFLKPLFIWNAK